MEQLVEQLLRSPKLEIYLEQINAVRAEEQLARLKFLEEITEDDKAEFINGDPISHSPAKASHNIASSNLFRLTSTYVDRHQIGRVGMEKWLISLSRNDYEPDLCFWRTSTSTAFQRNQMQFPAPDWLVEVLAPSTEANDRGIKFEDYAAHGVAKYLIIDPEKQTVEQYTLKSAGVYELILKSSNGFLRSKVIEGFEIPIEAIFDDALNLQTLKTFLA